MNNRANDWSVRHICSVLDSETERRDAPGLACAEAVIAAGLVEEEFQKMIDPIKSYKILGASLIVAHFAKIHSVKAAA